MFQSVKDLNDAAAAHPGPVSHLQQLMIAAINELAKRLEPPPPQEQEGSD